VTTAIGVLLPVRVLLDTGPTTAELDAIDDLFRAVGMDPVAEGHSYGGPPPTSAFLIVVNSALGPFLDRFAGTSGVGPDALRTLVLGLQDMRAEPSRWGRPHGVMLEDSHSGHGVLLPAGLPAEAYVALMDVDLAELDPNGSPLRLEWNAALNRWQMRLAAAARRYARRAPLRVPDADLPQVRELADDEVSRLWRLAAEPGLSIIAWQRAQIVLASAFGRPVPTIARQTATGVHRVRSVIRNFNRDGFASLDRTYTGREPAAPTGVEERDAQAVAARPPSDFGLALDAWDAGSLVEFLVTEGVVEDADVDWAGTVLEDLRSKGTGQ
jgi:hypothetical protein